MDTILKFSIPDEKASLENALNADRMRLFIDLLYEAHFRPHIKYENPILGKKLSKRDLEVIQFLWDEIHQSIEGLELPSQDLY